MSNTRIAAILVCFGIVVVGVLMIWAGATNPNM